MFSFFRKAKKIEGFWKQFAAVEARAQQSLLNRDFPTVFAAFDRILPALEKINPSLIYDCAIGADGRAQFAIGADGTREAAGDLAAVLAAAPQCANWRIVPAKSPAKARRRDARQGAGEHNALDELLRVAALMMQDASASEQRMALRPAPVRVRNVNRAA
ncbi:MAG: hypothetical protein KGL46_06755 [Hyphomicrobiales bacterium]|nr:hypothetical protein [Hyphomicrobiales bacterium]